MPPEAKNKLSESGDLIELSTSGITYEAVSGHPDIFFFKSPLGLISAPNTPEKYFHLMNGEKIHYRTGSKPVGSKYPYSALYNAACDQDTLIHRTDITDQRILESCGSLQKINIAQGYTRCSLIPLGGGSYITSDMGIFTLLNKLKRDVLLVSAEEIVLPGFSHGFFGGCCGVSGRRFFLAGSLNFHKNGKFIEEFLMKRNFEIIELYEGPLFDCGSIIFI